jgi:hypothetical protein
MPSLSPEQLAELRALLATLKETAEYRKFLNATAQEVKANADNTANATVTDEVTRRATVGNTVARYTLNRTKGTQWRQSPNGKRKTCSTIG